MVIRPAGQFENANTLVRSLNLATAKTNSVSCDGTSNIIAILIGLR